MTIPYSPIEETHSVISISNILLVLFLLFIFLAYITRNINIHQSFNATNKIRFFLSPIRKNSDSENEINILLKKLINNSFVIVSKEALTIKILIPKRIPFIQETNLEVLSLITTRLESAQFNMFLSDYFGLNYEFTFSQSSSQNFFHITGIKHPH